MAAASAERILPGMVLSGAVLFPNGQSETIACVVKNSNTILLQLEVNLDEGYPHVPSQEPH